MHEKQQNNSHNKDQKQNKNEKNTRMNNFNAEYTKDESFEPVGINKTFSYSNLNIS